MGRDFSKRRFDQDFVKCLATLESLAKSRKQMSGKFDDTNLKTLNSIVDSHTASMKHIIDMGAHVVTNAELDKIIEVSTAFGKSAHKHFAELLLVVFDSWKAVFDRGLEAASDREAYLTSTLEHWTSVQKNLDDHLYKTASVHLDDLIGDALLQLHYAAQAIEHDAFQTLHDPAAGQDGNKGTSNSATMTPEDAKDGMDDAA